MTRDVWLARHPYLQPVAEISALVDAAASRLASPLPTPHWDEYLPDFHAGIPLLQSERAGVEVADPPSVVLSMVAELAAKPLPAALADRCRALGTGLRSLGEAVNHPAAETADDDHDPVVPNDAALFRYLLWAVLARDLRPVVAAFAHWRDEERWLRNYCPTCGEAPAMGQLVGKDPGRLRLLACGCCGTRWRYRRTGCPFCERADDHRLAIVGVDGEGGLRIDYCESCRGYLKTYDGEGSENLLLADWTSLHLDLVARDRGLLPRAASLYQV